MPTHLKGKGGISGILIASCRLCRLYRFCGFVSISGYHSIDVNRVRRPVDIFQKLGAVYMAGAAEEKIQ